VIAIVLLFILGVISMAVMSMLSDEVRGWLAKTPEALLWLAARQLPAAKRVQLYEEAWKPELTYILQEPEGRPVTRLIVGCRYAGGHILSALRTSRHTRVRPAPNTESPDTQAGTVITLPGGVTLTYGRHSITYSAPTDGEHIDAEAYRRALARQRRKHRT